MSTIPMPIEGANVFWNTSEVSRPVLQATLDSLSLGKFMPEQRTNLACLQYACREYAKGESGKDHVPVVTPRKNKKDNGFHVFDVEQTESQNFANPDFGAKVDTDGNITVDVGYADATKLRDLFNEAKATVPAGSVGGTLVNIVKHYDGVTLRDRGGLYWIPPQNLEAWLLTAATFESQCHAEVDTMQTKVTTDTLKAVKRAIVKEVTEDAQAMIEEISGGKLREKGLQTRRSKAEELHRRINMIAAVLGEGLDELHSIVSIPEKAAATAIAQIETDDVFDAVIG